MRYALRCDEQAEHAPTIACIDVGAGVSKGKYNLVVPVVRCDVYGRRIVFLSIRPVHVGTLGDEKERVRQKPVSTAAVQRIIQGDLGHAGVRCNLVA